MLSKLIYNQNYDKNIQNKKEFRIQKASNIISTTRYNYGVNYNIYYPESQYNMYEPYFIQGLTGKRGPRGERGERGARGPRGKNIDPQIVTILENKIKSSEDKIENLYTTFFKQDSDTIMVKM